MDFYNTVMGKRFYEGTMPQLVKNTERIAVALEKLAEAKDAADSKAGGQPAEAEKREAWIEFDMARYQCPKCKAIVWNKTNYCPHCGTPMEGDEHGN